MITGRKLLEILIWLACTVLVVWGASSLLVCKCGDSWKEYIGILILIFWTVISQRTRAFTKKPVIRDYSKIFKNKNK